MKANRGQSIAEFALALPFCLVILLAVVEFALAGVRSIAAQHGAYRAARVSAVYQRAQAANELYAMLHPGIFRGGLVEEMNPAGNDVQIDAVAAPVAGLRVLSPATIMRRKSPAVDALPAGLSNASLRDGDTPSPYCVKEEGGYAVCGYPE